MPILSENRKKMFPEKPELFPRIFFQQDCREQGESLSGEFGAGTKGIVAIRFSTAIHRKLSIGAGKKD